MKSDIWRRTFRLPLKPSWARCFLSLTARQIRTSRDLVGDCERRSGGGRGGWAVGLRRAADGRRRRCVVLRGDRRRVPRDRRPATCADLGRRVGDAELARLCDTLDGDGKGALSLHEFVWWWRHGLDMGANPEDAEAAARIRAECDAVRQVARQSTPARDDGEWDEDDEPGALGAAAGSARGASSSRSRSRGARRRSHKDEMEDEHLVSRPGRIIGRENVDARRSSVEERPTMRPARPMERLEERPES